MIKIRDAVAVESPDAHQSILGHLTWYSIGAMLISRQELEQKMIQSGLGNGWMPAKIRVPDAFRRATAMKHRVKVSENEFKNYLCREVSSDKESVQRNIVIETVDTKGKRLGYNETAAIITLDKDNETIDLEYTESMAGELAREAVARFGVYKNNYSANSLRSVVMNILKSMSPTPVRPTGGVYFIPQKFEDRLSSVVNFLRLLEHGEGELVPLVNSNQMKEMVSRKLQDHLESVIKNVESAQAGGLLKGQIKQVIDDAQQAVKDFRDYESIIAGNISSMEDKILLIRNKIAGVIRDMATN